MRLTPELRGRCKKFASQVIRIYVQLPKQREEVRLVGHQLLRSGTSVAAHAREASRARSDAEFCSKIEALLQEADESQLWLELLEEDCEIPSQSTQPLWQEADQLIAIFVTMSERTKAAATKGGAGKAETAKR
jgi:four helix bundle protein